jgi:hypothetical protein
MQATMAPGRGETAAPILEAESSGATSIESGSVRKMNVILEERCRAEMRIIGEDENDSGTTENKN